MTQGLQSSFIPKGSITDVQPPKKPAGVVGVLAFTLFITSVLASVGMYFYKNMIRNDVESLQIELINAGKNIDKNTINEMTSFSKKLAATRGILEKHTVISSFLSSLSSSTVSSVFFNDFSYDDMRDGILTVTLKGQATSYGAVALQETVFAKNQYWKSVEFSNLRLAQDGAIDFDVVVSVDSKISVYNPNLPANSVSTTTPSSTDSQADNFGDIESLNLDDIETDFNNI